MAFFPQAFENSNTRLCWNVLYHDPDIHMFRVTISVYICFSLCLAYMLVLFSFLSVFVCVRLRVPFVLFSFMRTTTNNMKKHSSHFRLIHALDLCSIFISKAERPARKICVLSWYLCRCNVYCMCVILFSAMTFSAVPFGIMFCVGRPLRSSHILSLNVAISVRLERAKEEMKTYILEYCHNVEYAPAHIMYVYGIHITRIGINWFVSDVFSIQLCKGMRYVYLDIIMDLIMDLIRIPPKKGDICA